MKKGSVLLLSLFLIAFVVSIIGLIYSYNKRILLVAKQERDNYQKTNLLMKDIFTNLYMVNKFKDGFRIEGEDINSFSSVERVSSPSVSIKFDWVGDWGQTSSTITPTGLTINLQQGLVTLSVNIDNTPTEASQNISEYVNALKLSRYSYFETKRREIKDVTRKYISDLFDNFEKKISLTNEALTGIGKDTATGKYKLEYEVVVDKTKRTKTGEKKVNKKFSIEVEYNVSISFLIEASLSNESRTIQSSGIVDTRIVRNETGESTTEYKYSFSNEFNLNINTTRYSIIELAEFKIKEK